MQNPSEGIGRVPNNLSLAGAPGEAAAAPEGDGQRKKMLGPEGLLAGGSKDVRHRLNVDLA